MKEDKREETTSFNAGSLRIGINSQGFVISLYNISNKKEYIAPGQVSPLLSVWLDSGKFEPSKLTYNSKNRKISLHYQDGKLLAEVEILVKATHIRFQLKSLRGAKPLRIEWGPFPTIINKTIGETVGVVRDGDFAIGIQSLNIQTVAGASPTHYGSMLYAYAVEKEGGVENSAIALFGCRSRDALHTIGEIEIEEGLPHPTLDGMWAKISPNATLPYLITDFSEANFEEALELCKELGFKYIYHPGPFRTWGHFILDPERFPEGEESLRRCVEKAKEAGIGVGVHTLTAFITPNDPYVSPRPDPRLGGLGSSRLVEDITETATEIPIVDREPFLKTQNWGWDQKFVLVDEEIIRYTEVSDTNPPRLIGCTRGMFETRIASHKEGAEVRRLATHAYGTFYPGIANGMMDEMTKRLVELFNYCGLQQVSFDGLEGLWDYECQGPYAAHRFVKQCHDGWKQEVISDASGLLHYLWHIHTRMNWGEPWGKPMREGMAEYRVRNQDYFERNLFPHMMGWFEFRSASPQLEATTVDEIEWMLSKCAGYDAGFALVTSAEVFKVHGQGKEVKRAIREWEEARHLGVFSEEQKARLRDLRSDWHLERTGKNSWHLFPITFSSQFNYPSEPNSREPVIWKVENKFHSQPLKFILRVLPSEEKDSMVTNPCFEVNGRKVVFPVELKPTQYLIYEGEGMGLVYDRNWNLLHKVKGEDDVPILEKGEQFVRFSCEVRGLEVPALWIKFKTVGEPEVVAPKQGKKSVDCEESRT